jgi:hypothetical protein
VFVVSLCRIVYELYLGTKRCFSHIEKISYTVRSSLSVEEDTMSDQFALLAGDKPISFRRLMALRQIGRDTFASLKAAWPPTALKRAFGGHVYAQAMYAASRTVEKGMVVHVRPKDLSLSPSHVSCQVSDF